MSYSPVKLTNGSTMIDVLVLFVSWYFRNIKKEN